MSPKVAFYILDQPELKMRYLYACHVIEKAYSSGQTIYVHTASVEEAQNFDTQLWTFCDISFVPHEIYNQELNSNALILIGSGDLAINEKRDILVNLTFETPLFYKQFNHIIEIVPNNDNCKTAARKQYQAYKNSGYQIETFNIK